MIPPDEEALDRTLALVAAVRDACSRAAAAAYEDAGVQGLCDEGRWEAALGAIRSLDPLSLFEEFGPVSTGLAPADRKR